MSPVPRMKQVQELQDRSRTGPGASGEVQDHQEHHQDDEEQIQDDVYGGSTRSYAGTRGLKRVSKDSY